MPNRSVAVLSAVLWFSTSSLTLCGEAFADAPIQQADTTTFCSSNQKYCAHSTQNPAMTTVYAVINPTQTLWSRSEFVVKGFVSNDRKTIASCYGGLNLLPLDATSEFLLARLFRASGSVREVKVGDLFPSIRVLPRTASHLEWGRCVGFEEGVLLVERFDGTQWKSKPFR